jgi:hypothetical protein
MDPFHQRLARVALDAAGSYGFALAGGYAVQAHGFLNRMSADVDLFAEASGEFDFAEAVDAVIKAYRRDGLEVQAEVLAASFARLNVRSASDSAKVELGLDWRRNKPISWAVGPVLHADDAVANKVCDTIRQGRGKGLRRRGRGRRSCTPRRREWPPWLRLSGPSRRVDWLQRCLFPDLPTAGNRCRAGGH